MGADIHVLNLGEGREAAAWEQPVCSGAVPKAREMHASFLSRRANKTQLSCDDSTSFFLNILGGRDEEGKVHNDLCTLNLDDFSWAAPVEVPSFARCSHTASMIDETNALVYGGWDGKMGIYNEGKIFNMESHEWRDLDSSKTLPPGRF